MNTQDHEVIDRNGKRVTRNGILQDDDRLVVKMTMMDAANPALVAAAALADSIKRAEAFDARGHRPGFLQTQDAGNAGETTREQRDKRTCDAWKNPTPVLYTDKARKNAAYVPPTASNEALFAARDQAIIHREERLRDAWMRKD
jgi:hypothetical protein